MALAEMLKVSQGAISQWESGTTKPSLKHLLMLSSIFSCSINELFEKREGWRTNGKRKKLFYPGEIERKAK